MYFTGVILKFCRHQNRVSFVLKSDSYFCIFVRFYCMLFIIFSCENVTIVTNTPHNYY